MIRGVVPQRGAGISCGGVSEQSGRPERETAGAGDDDVVEQPDVEQRGRLRDAGRQHPVGFARFGAARRVIVDEDQLRRQQFERPFDDEAVVDHRPLHAALTDALPFDDAVRRRKVDCPALLVVELFQLGAEEADHVVARDERRRFGRLRLQDAPTQFRGGRNACRAAPPYAYGCAA